MGTESKKRRDAKKKLMKKLTEKFGAHSMDSCCTPTGCTAADGPPLFDLKAFRARR
ncbi:hypothetical protein QWI29_07655 [Mycolicibacterium neoaurum]|uniref:hypothetical protein n=1 Tax=Mycolicibacterium neoaurum TaxID=1795 RepID=UPI002673389B|nr:hypothetical protein [Mycolicibacterium neoaurum]MDO3399900.1 hypothetical protein [Mycolicibacterium neoaurum]